MATSISPRIVRRAQVALPFVCKFCKQSDKIVKWKCFDCGLIMCTECKDNIHPKFKSADYHRVLHLKKIGPTTDIEGLSFDITDIKEFSTQLRNIVSILVSDDGCLWICDFENRNKMSLFLSPNGLQKVKLKNNKVKVVSNIKPRSNISDIAVMLSGDLLIAVQEPKIKQIKKGTKKLIDSCYNTNPYDAISVHVTRDQKVIVGALKKDDTAGKHGVIIIMTIDGFHLKYFEHNENGECIFSIPMRIKSTKNGEVIVRNKDVGEEQPDQLVALSSDGKIIFVYEEKSSEDLCGFVFSPSENIIIVDRTGKLMILSGTGQLLKCIDTTNEGIFDPFSIAIATVGDYCLLYIGCAPDDISKKAKMYKMIFTENVDK